MPSLVRAYSTVNTSKFQSLALLRGTWTTTYPLATTHHQPLGASPRFYLVIIPMLTHLDSAMKTQKTQQ